MKIDNKIKNAQWIWCDTNETPNQYAHFIEDFDTNIKSATLYIAADMNYAVFVNGQYIPSFAYSDYPDCRSVDTLDISEFVKVGKNRLCVIGYCQITDGHTYKKGNAGVRFAIYCGDILAASSSTDTLTRQAPDFENGEIENITSQLSYSFHYDANLYDSWLETDYIPDSTWHKAVISLTKATVKERPIKPLVLEDRTSANILSYGTFKDSDNTKNEPAATKMQYAALSFKNRIASDNGPVSLPSENGVAFRETDGDGIYIILDLKHETAGLLEFDIELDTSAQISIGFGEHLDDLRVRTTMGGRQFAVVYNAKSGRQSFTYYFKRFGARYLQLHIYTQKVNLYYAGLRPVTYPLNYISDFDCDDLLMNKIYSVGMETLRLCMHEHYEDCPWREQGLYAMDSRVQMLCGYYAFKETDMPRESLRLLALGQRDDGLLEMCAPSYFKMTIPCFSLVFINSLKEYLDHSNDRAFIKEILPNVNKILECFASQLTNDGVLSNFKGERYWNFYEWSDGIDDWTSPSSPDDCQAPLQAMYIMASEAYLEICKICDITPFDLELSKKIESVRKACQKFWDSDKQIFRSRLNGDAPLNELVQAQFVCAGIATEEQSKILLEKMTNPTKYGLCEITQSHCIYKYEALLSKPEVYGKFVRQNIAEIWGDMLFQGATSFWETQRGAWDFDCAGSLCHGWSTIPIYIFHKYGKYVL